MERKAAPILAIIVAALAITQHPASGKVRTSSSHAAAAPTRAAQVPADAPRAPPAFAEITGPACAIGAVCDALVPYRDSGPWVASCDRFGTPPAQPPPIRGELVRLNSNAPEKLGSIPSDWCWPPSAAVTPTVIILMVPDPVTTHLALYFDRTIEVLESAAQQRNLFLDRYWLPWSVPGGATAPDDTAQDFRVNEILNVFRLGQPGLIIFSGHSPGPDPGPRHDDSRDGVDSPITYAFLVGESPTSGINRTQFEHAIKYSRVLSHSATSPVHVVGPFFSGSAPSALALTNDLSRPGQSIDFVSGTMTSRQQADLLRDSGVDLKQTQHDDAQAQCVLLEFLKRRSLTTTGANVAILQEDETRYGDAHEAAQMTCAPGDGPGEVDRFPKVRFIKFPRELSRLRNAADNHFGAAPTAPGQTAIVTTDELSWNWKDAAKDGDSVPAFATQQGPLSQQAVLLSIGDAIRQQNIKYVGITATDVFDILFLSKFLKISAPNTRIFVFDADLLMVKASSEGRELDGTLAITTYPLLARNRDWTAPDGFEASVSDFPSALAEGIYNAVLLQLDAGRPRNSAGPLLREYINPLIDLPPGASQDRPPLWLTMVGRTGFWPIRVEKNASTRMQPAPSPVAVGSTGSAGSGDVTTTPLTFDPPDGVSLLLQALLWIWSLIHFAGLKLARHAPYAWFRQFHLRTDVAQAPYAQQQTYYLLCATLALAAMIEMVAMSYFSLSAFGHFAFPRPHWFPYLFPMFYVIAGIVGFLLLIEAVGVSCLPIINSMKRIYTVPPWILYTLTISCWMYLNTWRDGEGVFFAQRALSFTSGVSPLLPIEWLLLIYYLWAWTSIRKVRLAESKQVHLPRLELLGPAGGGLAGYWEELRAATDGIVFNPQIGKAVASGFALAVLFLLRPWETLRSIEGLAYDILLNVLVAMICLIIVMVWSRYLYIWNRLRRILRGIERTPLRRAFSRFPGTYSWSPLWYEDTERRAYALSARSVECFQALIARGTPDPKTLEIRDGLTSAFARVVSLDTDAADDDARSLAVRTLQSKLASAAEFILEQDLLDRWLRDRGSDSLEQAAASSTATPVPTEAEQVQWLEEEFVALRFVSLIQYESGQLKNLVALVVISFVLAVVAVASYPFLAARQCVWSLTAAFVVFGAAIVASFAQMDRDAILSRLSGTVAGRLDLNFYLRAISYGGLPLLTLLASQFPVLGRSLSTWLTPALNALH